MKDNNINHSNKLLMVLPEHMSPAALQTECPTAQAYKQHITH